MITTSHHSLASNYTSTSYKFQQEIYQFDTTNILFKFEQNNINSYNLKSSYSLFSLDEFIKKTYSFLYLHKSDDNNRRCLYV